MSDFDLSDFGHPDLAGIYDEPEQAEPERVAPVGKRDDAPLGQVKPMTAEERAEVERLLDETIVGPPK